MTMKTTWAAPREPAAETEHKGYIIAVSDGDGYIPDAVHIERDDRVNIYPNDYAAARAAEEDGIKLIHGLPYIPDGMYLDTPENRAIVERTSKQARLAMPAEGELKRRLLKQLDDGFIMYRESMLAFDKERLFSDAGKIAAIRAAYEYFRHEHPYTVKEAEFLLKFHNPLEVVYDRWDARSPETVFAGPEKALGEFALAEEAPAKSRPHSLREWKKLWREEMENRPPAPKKEPGRGKQDPDL
jgi:hypothetical protein